MKKYFSLTCIIFSITLAQIPKISSFAPQSSNVGETIVISGTDFNSVAEKNFVFFGGVKGKVIESNSSSLKVIVPIGAQFGPITVMSDGLSAKSALSFIPLFAGGGEITEDLFSPKINISTQNLPHEIVMGDMDQDGKLDLVVSHRGSGAIAIYENISSQNEIEFAPPIIIPVGIWLNKLIVGDIDSDGKLDILVVDENQNTLTIIRNINTSDSISSSSFAAQKKFVTGYNPRFIGFEDFDGDGKLDISVSNSGSNTVSIFRNLSFPDSIVLQKGVELQTGNSPLGLSTGDIDNDGRVDIVVSNLYGNSISIFRNVSNKGIVDSIVFSPKVDLAVGSNPCGVVIEDIDLDGLNDILVANSYNNHVSILKNICHPQDTNVVTWFEPIVNLSSGQMPWNIVMGELNGDGRPDIVSSDWGGSAISVIENKSAIGTISVSSFGSRIGFPALSSPLGIAIGDLNGDSQSDIVVTHWEAGKLSIFRNNYIDKNVPSQLIGISGNEQVALTWNKVTNSGCMGYRIFGGTNIESSSLFDSTSSLLDTTLTILNLINGQSYYFKVASVDSNGKQSAFSNIVHAIPGNLSPIANILHDTVVFDVLRERTVAITYSSFGSIDPDGTIDSIDWYVNGVLRQKGPSFTYNYGPGTNQVMMIVKDNGGATDTSTATITKGLFKNKLKGPIYTPISMYDDSTIYAVASGDAVYKYDINGKLDYYLQVGLGNTYSASVGSNGVIYIASEITNNLYAFSKTGSSIWPALSLGAKATASPTVDNVGNKIYIGAANNNFQAINQNTGNVLWNYFTDAPILHSAVITSDKRLIFSTIKGTVYGFNININQPMLTWSLPVGDSINTAPAIDREGDFYFGTTSGKVIKVRMKANQIPLIVWEKSFVSKISSSPVIDAQNNLYIGTEAGRLLSIKTTNGELNWELKTSGAIRSTASISPNGIVYFGNDANSMIAVNSFGEIVWMYTDSSSIISSSLYHNGVIYFGNTSGEFTAIYDGEFENPDKQNDPSSNNLFLPIWGTFQGNNQRTGVQSVEQALSNTSSNRTDIPAEYSLSQNYPNPFNPSTSIGYSLSAESRVSLKIFNTLGQKIGEIVDGIQSAGWYESKWDAKVASGIYFYRIDIESTKDPTKKYSQMKKMILLK